jgi:Stage II sporulation protein E (SpoIIE)
VARMIRFFLGATPRLLTPESRVTHGRRAKWFILPAVSMLVMIAAGAPSYAQQPSPLVMQGLGHATLPLDGAWQFHPGDDLAWASPTVDDSTWETIQVGRAWEGQGHPGYTGFAWYRLHLILPPSGPTDWNLALLLPDVQDACEVYWNGVLVGSLGKVPPHPVWYLQAPPSGFVLGSPQSGVLAIRVWKAPHFFMSYPDEGGLISIPQAGSAQAIENLVTAARYRWLLANQFALGLAVLSSIVGLLALLAWLRDRNRMMLLWLALAMVHGPIFALFDIPGFMSFRLFYALIAPAVAINDVALWFLLIALLSLNDRAGLVRWTKICAIAVVGLDLLDTSLQFFDWSRGPAHLLLADIGLTIPAVLLELWGLVLVLSALRKRLDAARWMLAISALLADLIQAAYDVSTLGVRWTHWTFRSKLEVPLFTIAGCRVDALALVNTLLLVAIVYAAWRYSVEQSQRQSALEQEYHSAQELQQVLIPESLPSLPGYLVTSAYRPAQEVGGDFFQLMALPDNGALLVIGDVSGKGLHAAMTVALIVGSIRSTVETTDDPAAILAALNRRLHGRLRSGFATCLVLRLDAEGRCLVANAGHLPPYLNGEEVPLPPALPLGLVPEAEYEPIEVSMGSGDRLTLYTDGLLEARNVAGELFGFTRIAELLATPRDAKEIAEAAQQFGQEDDITVLTLTFAGVGVVHA